MKFDQDAIIKILLDGNYITEEDVNKAKEYSEEHRVPLEEYLIVEGLTNSDIIGQAIAESLGVPYSNLNAKPPTKEQVLLIPEDVAKRLHAVVFDQTDSEIIVATDSPSDEVLKTDLSALFPDKEIKTTFALSDDIDAVFVNYQQGLKTEFSKIIESKGRIAPEILDPYQLT